MGLLDNLVANLGGADLSGATVPPIDPWAEEDRRRAAEEAAKPKPFGPFAGMLNAPYSMPGGPGSAPLDLPPSTNDPASSEPKVFKDGQELDRPKPDNGLNGQPQEAANAPLSLAPGNSSDSAQLPPNAAPTGPAPPMDSGAPGLPGLGDGLKSIAGKIFDPNHAATWMALASGFAGAPNIGQGIGRAAAASVPAIAADRANEIKQTGIASTYRALVARGVPAAEALAAVYNPEVMKATAAKYFETKPFVPHKIGVDMMGNDIMGSFNPNNNKFYDAAGHELGADGKPAGSTPGGGAGMQVLAKGVKEYNSELPAKEYKDQFSPEVQAAIDSYVNGETMPTGNPRLKALATNIKTWAQTYGAKAGIPVSDSEFSRKRTMQTQIASSSPNSMGGILSNGKSAFGHLATLAENFVTLGNRSGPDIPGGSMVGYAANRAGNSLLPTPETSGKLEAVRDNAGKYGAEATKFYAGTGGGVEERLSALHGIAQPGTLATEQAAYLKTEKDLMVERLNQKESQIRDVMGERWLQEHPVRTPELQKHIERIDASIKKLQTGAVGGSEAPATPVAPLAPGESKAFGNVTIRRLN